MQEESFMDKFKRGKNENYNTTKKAKEKAEEGYHKSKQGYLDFKTAYNQKAAEGDTQQAFTDFKPQMPTLPTQAGGNGCSCKNCNCSCCKKRR